MIRCPGPAPMTAFGGSRPGESELSYDPKLLDIICCPVTRAPMEVMSEQKLAALNRRIRDAKLVTRSGTVLTEALREALVTRDGRLAYPVVEGIPVLLEDHGIVLSQLEDA